MLNPVESSNNHEKIQNFKKDKIQFERVFNSTIKGGGYGIYQSLEKSTDEYIKTE